MNRLVRMILKNIWVLPGAYAKLCRHAKHPENYPEQQRWDHIRFIMGRAIAAGNVDLQVSGVENLRHDSGFMLYGNHQGLFDVVAIAATCPVPLGCVYKKEINNVPLLKQIYACTKSFPMDRADARQSLQVIKAVTEEVEQGRNYLIFPEGTRSRQQNTLLPFHGGSFRCAIKAKCPVVPIAFVDSWKVLDQKGDGKVTVHIRYLDPILPEEFAGMKAAELAELVKSRIEAAIGEITG